MNKIAGISGCGKQKCPLVEIAFEAIMAGGGRCLVQIRKKSKDVFAVWICWICTSEKVQKVIDEKVSRAVLQKWFEQGFFSLHDQVVRGFSEGRARARFRRILEAV